MGGSDNACRGAEAVGDASPMERTHGLIEKEPYDIWNDHFCARQG